MEKSSKHIDKITQDWVEEAGIEQPSFGFANNVMRAIEAKAVREKVYRPLISLRGWGLVAAFFVVSVVLLYYIPIGEIPYLKNMDITNVPSIKNPFAGLEVSKTMVYAVGFLVLFLIQIPFLKKQFVN